ncbi:MAG TPA: hypothetical protein VNN22_18050 [Verrucomicrobiae bacterium]|nr:hypothetical protein [Verrucomicrobiae bacterium]
MNPDEMMAQQQALLNQAMQGQRHWLWGHGIILPGRSRRQMPNQRRSAGQDPQPDARKSPPPHLQLAFRAIFSAVFHPFGSFAVIQMSLVPVIVLRSTARQPISN